MNGALERKLLAGFGLTAVMFALAFGVALDNSRQLKNNGSLLLHTKEVMDGLQTVSGLMIDVETGVRGFVITGQEAYLEPYRQARPGADEEIQQLKQLTADNPVQQKRFPELERRVTTQLEYFDRVLRVAREQGPDAARKLVASGEGKEGMDAVRKQLDEMRAEEERLLHLRQQASDENDRRAGGIQLLLGTLILASLLGAYLLVRHHLIQRRQAETALRESEENLTVTLHSIGDAVLATDVDGRVTRLNPIAEKLTGWTQAEAAGRPVADVFIIINEETRARAVIPVEKVLATGEIHGLANHTVIIARDGTEHPIADSASPIRDKKGDILGVVLVFRDVTEEKKAEEIQRQLAAIVESSNDAILSKSLDGIVTSWNPGAERLFGYPAAEIIGRPITRIFPTDRLDEEPQILARLRNGASLEHFETVRVTKDGRRLDVSATMSPIKDSAGQIVGVSKIVRDITERKQAGKVLAEFKAALDEHAIVAITDTHGKITYVNDKFSSISQHPREELLGRDHRIVNSGHHSKDFFRDLWETVLSGRVWKGEIKNRAKDGTPYWVNTTIVPFLGQDGRPVQFIAIQADITGRKQAQDELDRFFSLSLDFLCIAHADGYFKRVSPAVTDMLGWTPEEFLARPFIDFVHPDDRLATLCEVERQVVAGEPVLQFENRYQHKDGSWRVLSWKSVPHEGGMMYGTARDVTEQRQTEQQIQKLNENLERRAAQLEEVNKELEAFSYSVSHDLRAPLRHVQGYVEMLQRAADGQLSEKATRYLKVISEASTEMGQLIDDLLDFSRMGRIELHESRENLERLVRDSIKRLEMTTNARNILWKIGPLPDVFGDAALLRQVLANLLGNAVKYSRERNPAEIEIGCAGEEEERVVLFVRDNGAGFDMQYAHKLFGVFQRLHRSEDFEGTGIGLATVRRVISRHGGRTWAEGKVGEGATFYFTLKPATNSQTSKASS